MTESVNGRHRVAPIVVPKCSEKADALVPRRIRSETPYNPRALRLSPGGRLGPYEIVGPLGAGGMGEVYRARDPRLGRDVAVKVLPADRGRDEDALARFEREAKAVAALSHPNILAIHDLGRDDDVIYAVTELLEGETLGSRLRSGSIPTRKAVEIGAQIARGLAAAHARGIVHRDLKPDNVFLARDAQVKILDFGLATMTEAPAVSEDDRTRTRTPRTDPGTVLGTVGYMSPEQVRGLPTDARSDLFTLGAILYEMLAGKRAFSGPTPADTSSAILNQDPPEMREVGREIPAGVEIVIRRCLEKNPEERFQSASDLAFDLERLSGSSVGQAIAAAPPKGRSGTAVVVAALAVVALAAVAAGAYVLGTRSGGDEVPSFNRLTFKRGSIRSARVAPDGQTIVYGAAWDGDPIRVFTTRPDSPESRRLDLPDADILAISSKGEMAISIGRTFLSPHQNTGTLARVALAGGAPRLVLENVQEADWSPDGESLAAVHDADGVNRLEYPIGKVLHETAGWFSGPRVSPDGRLVAFFDHDLRWDNRGRVAVVDLTGKVTHLTPTWSNTAGLAWSRDGSEILFAASRADMARGIHAVGLDGTIRKIYQQANALTVFDILPDDRVLVGSTDLRRETHFGSGEAERDLSWLDWSLVCFLSRDGKSALLNEQGEGGREGYSIYVRGTDGSPPVEVGAGIPFAISPDGRWVLARSPDSKLVLYPTGPGTPRDLGLELKGGGWAGWFPDGRRILFGGYGERGENGLVVLDVETGSRALATDDLRLEPFSDPVSPDGTRAFTRDASGRVYLLPLDGGDRVPVEGLEPEDRVVRWSDDSRSLFFYRQGMPAAYGRLELSTGRREILGALAPRDRAGTVGIWPALFSGDGRSVVYSFPRFQTSLYLVGGVN